jgi:CRISPR type I-E-associated protein CasB/Cse2
MHTQGTAVPSGQGTAGFGSARADRIAYTVAEVAALLGKHSNTVYGWVRSGALPSERTTSSEATRRRFEALGTASTFEEVSHHARGLISQFRTHDIPLDYGRFADQLVGLLHPASADRVRLSWGRDFYQPAAGERTTDETAVAGEAATTEEAQ